MSYIGVQSARPTIKTLTYRLLRVSFSQTVVIDSNFNNLDNYEITALTEGADEVTVQGLQGFSSSNETTNFVDIRISKATKGAIYKLVISNLLNTENYLLISMEGYFMGRDTKMDSVHEALSSAYKIDTESTLGHVLLALSIIDEEIGGKENYDALPPDITAVGPSTYGESTYGVSTFGG